MAQKIKFLFSYFSIFVLFFLLNTALVFSQDIEVFTHKLSQSTPSYQFWTTTPAERVFKDSEVPDEIGAQVKFYAAKNEFEPFQVIVKPASSGNITINISDFGAGITSEIYQVEYVNITQITDYMGREGDYPDPLWPLENNASVNLTANENTAFWFNIFVPKTAAKGDYTANVTIADINIPIKLHVFDFAIPDEIHVKSQMNFNHGIILDKYNVYNSESGYGENYWMYVDKIKQFFIDHHLTLKSVHWPGGVTGKGGGPFFDNYCETETLDDPHGIWGFEEPAQRYLNGTGLMDGKFTAPFNDGTGFPSFMAATFQNNDSSVDQRPSSLCNVTRTNNDWYIANNLKTDFNTKWFEYIKKLQDYLKNLGYIDKAYYYFANEPQNQDDYDAVAWYSKALKAAAPELKLMVSEEPKPEIYNNATYGPGEIDIWLPVLNNYDPEVSHGREKNHGEETWIYFLHGTRPPYFNPITLDHPGIESKFTGWFLWKYRIKGIAYYSLNTWSPNPWTDPMNSNHNGDLFMLYPPSKDNDNITYGANNHRFVPSIRFELMRDSLEDYEYLYMLNNNANPEVDVVNSADTQADKIISGLTSYTRDSEFMYNLRRVIGLKNGNEIAEIPDINPPPKHPRAEGEPGNYYINFQNISGEPTANPLVVDGKTYMKIGNALYSEDDGYGWYKASEVPDTSFYTFWDQWVETEPKELLASGVIDDYGRKDLFEFDLPNGTYNVTVCAGSRSGDRPHVITIEGISFIDHEVTNNSWIKRTKQVLVTDNKLSLVMGVFEVMGYINYLEIEAVILPKIPVAEFAANTISGNAPFAVQFTDQSTNTPTSWQWDFDNNGSIDSTEQNPSYTYEDSGTYSVKLTVSNADGSDSIVKTDYIVVKTAGIPVIGSVYPLYCIAADQNEAVISVEGVTGLNTITRVWAAVRGPNAASVSENDLPVFDLTDIGAQKYQGTYNDFTEAGKYSISIYAKDSADAVSEPVNTTLIKGPFEKGDINADGNIGLDDCILGLKILTGADTIQPLCLDYTNLGIFINNDNIGLEEVIYILDVVSTK